MQGALMLQLYACLFLACIQKLFTNNHTACIMYSIKESVAQYAGHSLWIPKKECWYEHCEVHDVHLET